MSKGSKDNRTTDYDKRGKNLERIYGVWKPTPIKPKPKKKHG